MGNTVGQRDLAPQTGRPVYLSADGMPIYKTGGITIDWPNVTAVGVDTTIPIEGTFVANGKRYLRYGQVMARNVVKETQALTFGGTVSGGTFTITVTRLGMTKTTAAIAFNAAAIAVQGALEALDNVEPGDVVVTGGPGPTAYTLTWQTAEDVAQVTVNAASLTGTAPTLTPSTTTQGTTSLGKFFPAINTTTLNRADVVVLNFTVLEDEPMSNHNGGPIIGGKVFLNRLLVSDVTGVSTQPSLANLLAACPQLIIVND